MVDLKFVSSSFGGGWLLPVSSEARDTYVNAFGEEPTFLAPVGQEGWIIEPYEMADTLVGIQADGFTLLVS